MVGCSAQPAASEPSEPVNTPEALSESTPLPRVSNDELLQRLAPRLSKSQDGLVWRKRKDGGYGVRLEGRFSHATLAQRGPDGRITTTCVDDVRQAEQLLKAGGGAP
jgi:hypothetical protein